MSNLANDKIILAVIASIIANPIIPNNFEDISRDKISGIVEGKTITVIRRFQLSETTHLPEQVTRVFVDGVSVYGYHSGDLTPECQKNINTKFANFEYEIDKLKRNSEKEAKNFFLTSY